MMVNTIKVGDIIKSYDFPHTKDFFCIGKVELIDEDLMCIHCSMIKQVSEGRVLDNIDSNPRFSTVFLGEHWMEDKFVEPRIQVIG